MSLIDGMKSGDFLTKVNRDTLILEPIHKYLEAGVIINDVASSTEEGTP